VLRTEIEADWISVHMELWRCAKGGSAIIFQLLLIPPAFNDTNADTNLADPFYLEIYVLCISALRYTVHAHNSMANASLPNFKVLASATPPFTAKP
jgi:hypothetical protein